VSVWLVPASRSLGAGAPEWCSFGSEDELGAGGLGALGGGPGRRARHAVVASPNRLVTAAAIWSGASSWM
jgi:hypothetical protein